MQEMVRGLQQIAKRTEASAGSGLKDAMPELKVAGELQRKLSMVVLATESPHMPKLRTTLLQCVSALNLQQPWHQVISVHKGMLVGAHLPVGVSGDISFITHLAMAQWPCT